ncbi:MAG: epimerase, partial [Planctomycetaceae bacterium]
EINFPPWSPMKGAEAGASLTGMQTSADHGLRARPLEETVRDLLAWHETRPPERKSALRAGLTPEKEAQILAAWRAHEAA